MTQYTIYIRPSALIEIKALPGNIKQRVKRAIDYLANEPYPSNSKALNIQDFNAWRLRLDRWRILYTVTENHQIVDILAVRKRPPYDYKDLEQLLSNSERE
ncbi:MAG: type II toxin-antitoxin system RelE/ParE family toxin [Coleofasciculaceae cyanobacterium SM2_1_6]|nr:type II toxin-antitoxin system RelE/ParE family toxin [Coleofasciculaceae cyanobacterium SM2_1_6]